MRQYPDIDRDWGNWFAGFVDGEGCFHVGRQIRSGTPHFYLTILLRADDAAVLYEIVSRTGCGKVRLRRAYGYDGSVNRKPQAFWRVCARADLLRMVEILDAHPLRAKKSRDYTIWREGVIECARVGAVGTWVRGKDWSRAWELGHALRSVRKWDDQQEIVVLPGVLPEPQMSLLERNSSQAS